jgi:hypothetical protein
MCVHPPDGLAGGLLAPRALLLLLLLGLRLLCQVLVDGEVGDGCVQHSDREAAGQAECQGIGMQQACGLDLEQDGCMADGPNCNITCTQSSVS